MLTNKTVVITGSSRGIGLAAAAACAREGASVVISSRTDDAVRIAVESLKNEGLNVTGVKADVTSFGDLQNLLRQAEHIQGRVNVWINNAGIAGGYRTLHSMSECEIEAVVTTNLLGVLYSCKLMIPYLLEHGGGSIINIGGKGGKGDVSPYLTTYAATKTAVTSLTRSLAAENRKESISINCLFPGIVETDMWQDIETCPQTVSRLEFIPVLIDAWATPIERVTRKIIDLCCAEPGKQSGRCYSAGSPYRYFKAPYVFFKYFAGKNRQKGKGV